MPAPAGAAVGEGPVAWQDGDGHTVRMPRRIASALLALWLVSCAAPPPDSERQRVNAQKQQDLKQMLELGQRN